MPKTNSTTYRGLQSHWPLLHDSSYFHTQHQLRQTSATLAPRTAPTSSHCAQYKTNTDNSVPTQDQLLPYTLLIHKRLRPFQDTYQRARVVHGILHNTATSHAAATASAACKLLLPTPVRQHCCRSNHPYAIHHPLHHCRLAAPAPALPILPPQMQRQLLLQQQLESA